MIGTALGARAELIVTGDKPLRSVGTYQGIHIIGVRDAVTRLTTT